MADALLAMGTAPSPAGSLRLASDEVHVWCVRLDVPPGTEARLYATLMADECDRSARLRFRHDQRHFIVAHGVLRELLGRYLQTRPGRIRYVRGAHGKPELDPMFGGRLKFNLSHSAGMALIAIATDSDVGVDVELIRPQSDCGELARQFFSAAEVNQLSALPNHLYAEGFLGCWTKKEACLKATGDGLATPLNGFTVPLTTDPGQGPRELHWASNDSIRAKRWSIHTLRPAPHYIGALAIEGSGSRLCPWHWKPSRA